MGRVKELLLQSISLIQIKIQKDTLEAFNQYNNYKPMTDEYSRICWDRCATQTKRDKALRLLEEAVELIDQETKDGIYQNKNS